MANIDSSKIIEKLEDLLAEFQTQTATLELANLVLDTLFDLVNSNAVYLESHNPASAKAQGLIIQILECSKTIRAQSLSQISMAHTPSRSSSTSQSEPLQQTLYSIHEPININLFAPEAQQMAAKQVELQPLKLCFHQQVKSGFAESNASDTETRSSADKDKANYHHSDDSEECFESENSNDEDYKPQPDSKGKARARITSNTVLARPTKRRSFTKSSVVKLDIGSWIVNVGEKIGSSSDDICSPIDDIPNELTPLKKLIMYEWLKKNIDHPYLSQEKKFQFSYFLQLSVTQIEDFFSNARRRTICKKKTPLARQRALAAKMRKTESHLHTSDVQPDPKLLSVLLDGGVKIKLQRQKPEDGIKDTKEESIAETSQLE
ncbi:hypothetical protein HDV06_001097 [Boothiomyces sp. JEL0866]|nr:hypothetical protein HDV06_001097 [Boothiomyces sp. JEL0866]